MKTGVLRGIDTKWVHGNEGRAESTSISKRVFAEDIACAVVAVISLWNQMQGIRINCRSVS